MRQVGSRSFIIQFTDKKGVNRIYQRDAAMLSLIPPNEIKGDPSDIDITNRAPHNHHSIKKTLQHCVRNLRQQIE